MIPPLLWRGARHTSLLPAAVSQLSRDGAALCPGLHALAVDSAVRGADSQQQQCSLPRHLSTEAKPMPSVDPRAKAALMMQSEQKQTRGSKAQRTGLKLSPGMENMKATLFSILNDASSTATSAPHRDAVRGLRLTLQKGLEQAKADQAKLQRATPQGSSPLAMPLILPAEYRADKEMFYACFSALCRFYALPVHYFSPSEYARRPEPSKALEAAEEMEALLVAMDATPYLWIDQWFMDCMMCALRFAGRPDRVRVLLQQGLPQEQQQQQQQQQQRRQQRQRSAQGPVFAKLPAPTSQGIRHAFFAFKEGNDAQEMWSLLEQASSMPGLDTNLSVELPKFVHMTALGAAHARRWDIVEKLQQLSTKSSELGMSHSARLVTMAAAAQDDQLHIARAILAALAQERKVIPREYIAQRREQQQQQQEQGQQGQGKGSQASSSNPNIEPSKINDGPLLEVLQACARWPDVSEAKEVALQVFEVLERSLSISNYHPRSYYLKLLGEDPTGKDQDAAALPLPPPLDFRLKAPSVPAHQALAHVLARACDWSAVFDVVARLEQLVVAGIARPAAVSVHRGLCSAAEGIANAPSGVKAAAAAAYNILALRQASGQPVSCAMMNIVLRGLALGGEVDACGRLFEEYKVAGLPHDFAAYNAVIESCCVAKKPLGAYGVLDYMATQNVAPGTDTYDLLLRAFVSAEDVDGALEALQRLRKDNARAKYSTVLAGLNLARRTYHMAALSAFQQELAALDAHERRQQQMEQQQEQQQQQQELGAPVGEDGLESWAYKGGDAGFEGVPGDGWDGGEGDEGSYGYDGYEEEGGGPVEEPFDDDRQY